MTRDEVTAVLRAHEAELRAAGIEALDLFGSVARGEERPDSDVDLACRLTEDAKIGLFQFAGLKLRMEDVLGRSVDLVTIGMLKGRFGDNARRDLQRVFG